MLAPYISQNIKANINVDKAQIHFKPYKHFILNIVNNLMSDALRRVPIVPILTYSSSLLSCDFIKQMKANTHQANAELLDI